MIEKHIFNPDCVYGRGMMSTLVGNILQHPHVKFYTIEKDGKQLVVVECLHCDSVDDDGTNEHELI